MCMLLFHIICISYDFVQYSTVNKHTIQYNTVVLFPFGSTDERYPSKDSSFNDNCSGKRVKLFSVAQYRVNTHTQYLFYYL